ncbi:Glycyl-tRNA synthetase, beta subunit [Megamonas hypermegale ART12/1]|nr:Glycyl-tRNA synthetase, beta subunit [Megamonas hypermegale ART12/1]
MAKDLLLEIGTEEVPAHFMPGILAQLKEKATAKFQEMRLDFDEVTTLGTPRRTALLVKILQKLSKVHLVNIKAHLLLSLLIKMAILQKQLLVLLVAKK